MRADGHCTFVSGAALPLPSPRAVPRRQRTSCSARGRGRITRRAALCAIPAALLGAASAARAGDTSNTPFLFPQVQEVRLENGARYFDLTEGKGAAAEKGSQVLLHYTSRLGGLYGLRLDGTRDGTGNGSPIKYTLGSLKAVPGFDAALVGMRPGGVRRVVCPPGAAYRSPDDFPVVKDFFARRRLLSVLNTNRDSSIVFDIEVLRVK